MDDLRNLIRRGIKREMTCTEDVDFGLRTIDEGGGLELESQVERKASVVKGVPVEAQGKDEDGRLIHMLLHADEGRPVELEFFRKDPATVRTLPPPSPFELMVLPPTPANGWASRSS